MRRWLPTSSEDPGRIQPGLRGVLAVLFEVTLLYM